MNLRQKDQVKVLAGKDRGKTGVVERVIHKTGRVIVAGINLGKKSVKPSKNAPKGGQIEILIPVHASNLQYICPNCNQPTRVSNKIDKDGTKVRVCKKCQNQPIVKAKTETKTK
jgi:large subunit ribosomal protein L24